MQNVSIQWKVMTLTFLVIGRYLEWKVGNEAQVSIGTNSIMGCGHEAFLDENFVLTLQELGRCTLNLVSDPTNTTLWSQCQLLAQEIGIDDEMSQGQESFLTKLRRSYKRLSGVPKIFSMGKKTKTGLKIVKLNYISLQSLDHIEIKWWW